MMNEEVNATPNAALPSSPAAETLAGGNGANAAKEKSAVKLSAKATNFCIDALISGEREEGE